MVIIIVENYILNLNFLLLQDSHKTNLFFKLTSTRIGKKKTWPELLLSSFFSFFSSFRSPYSCTTSMLKRKILPLLPIACDVFSFKKKNDHSLLEAS